MLPNEGKEGERASCDWISFKLTLLILADVETCTVNYTKPSSLSAARSKTLGLIV